MRKSLYITLSAVALLLVSAASYALASSQDVPAVASSTIRACKNNRTGALYLKAKCPKGYSSVVWNVRGPAGPAGAPGAKGPNGTNGANGANGAAAPTGRLRRSASARSAPARRAPTRRSRTPGPRRPRS